MEIQEQFKYLNYQIMKRKDNSGEFILLNCLDQKMNPVKFFIFNEELVSRVKSSNYSGFQDIYVTFELQYSNNIWNVRVLDIQD